MIDTDAEGRLVLADAIHHAIDAFRPRAVIDLATLTGSIITALGHHRAGIFGTDAALMAVAAAAGEAVGEPLWPMPIGARHREDLASDIADIRQCAPSGSGRLLPDACHAAAFLREFVGRAALGASRHRRCRYGRGQRMRWARPGRPASARGCSTGWWRCASRPSRDRDRLLPPDADAGWTRRCPGCSGRVLGSGGRAHVLCGEAERAAALDAALWTVPEPDWLPHGMAGGENDALQPILLGTADVPPGNGARFLFLVDGADSARLSEYDRVFDLFDGADEAAVAAARARWSAAKAAGHALAYWQQGAGGWERRQ